MSMNSQEQSSNPSNVGLNPQAQQDPKYTAKVQDGFVKLAMRNMVKKGSTSLFHFGLTVLGVFGALIGLAIVFH